MTNPQNSLCWILTKNFMLKGISPFLSPDLLSTLYRMGHGDEIILADAHFNGETFNPKVEASYLKKVQATQLKIDSIEKIERFAFYERAKKAFAVVMTGETVKYGNLILKKGVTPF